VQRAQQVRLDERHRVAHLDARDLARVGGEIAPLSLGHGGQALRTRIRTRGHGAGPARRPCGRAHLDGAEGERRHREPEAHLGRHIGYRHVHRAAA
jgi:hypothetical protein